MGLFDRISRVLRANADTMTLEQAVICIKKDLEQMRQQLIQVQTKMEDLQLQAKKALTNGDESLARECLIQKGVQRSTAEKLKARIDEQSALVAKYQKVLPVKVSAMELFERMEEKVRQADLRHSHVSMYDTDTDLEDMKDQLLKISAQPQPRLVIPSKENSFDAELESLKTQLDDL